jgi:hypothetical protein
VNAGEEADARQGLKNMRAHLLARLRGELEVTPAPQLQALHEELPAYPCVEAMLVPGSRETDGIMPMHCLQADEARLTLCSTVTTFGTVRDVMLDELTVAATRQSSRTAASKICAAHSISSTCSGPPAPRLAARRLPRHAAAFCEHAAATAAALPANARDHHISEKRLEELVPRSATPAATPTTPAPRPAADAGALARFPDLVA